MKILRIILPIVLCLIGGISQASWMVEPGYDGAPHLSQDGAPVIDSHFIAWGNGWKWAGTQWRYGKSDDQETAFEGRIGRLDIDFDGRIRHNGADTLSWAFQWRRNQAFPDAIGHGIEFVPRGLLTRQTDRIRLLPRRQGWQLLDAGRPVVRVVFDPPAAELTFKKGRIRALFATGIEPGTATTTMRIELPEASQVSIRPGQRFGPPRDERWTAIRLDPVESPVDLSFLNDEDRPAGSHGRARRDGERLVFADGTPIRFWGTNLQGQAVLGTPDAAIPAQARRLARLGFNLVRIHHIDSSWVRPNIFGNRAPDTRHLDARALERLDRWIDALEKEGIHVWLDLFVGRRFTRSDRIDGFDDIAKGAKTIDPRGFNYFNRDIEQAMADFTRSLLRHRNRYNGRSYAEDPGIVAVLLVNENDLSHHFGNALLANKGHPRHNRLFERDARAFARKWHLSTRRITRSWEPGDAKIYLNDVEHRFNRRMIEVVRKTGFDGLIATTNLWGGMPLSGLPSLTDGDLIDVHQYLDSGFLALNPLLAAPPVARIAMAQIEGMPLSISEWNLSRYPRDDRILAPLYLASLASLQGWDAPMLYGYAQARLRHRKPRVDNWSSWLDAGLMSAMPAAALLFRRGDVALAKRSYLLTPDARTLFQQRRDADDSATIRTLAEQSRVQIRLPRVAALPWLKTGGAAPDARSIADLDRRMLAADSHSVRSDTGELERDWQRMRFVADTPRSQLAEGLLGERPIELGDVELRIDSEGIALIAVQSLDETPIREAKRLLVTVLPRIQPTRKGGAVFARAPIGGEILIQAPKGLRVSALDPSGKRHAARAAWHDGRYRLRLDENPRVNWFLFENTPLATTTR